MIMLLRPIGCFHCTFLAHSEEEMREHLEEHPMHSFPLWEIDRNRHIYRRCSHCGEPGEYDGGLCPNCHGISTSLSWERFLLFLHRLRESVEGQDKCVYWDDDTIGDKDSECTWGYCTKRPEVFPDPEDHIWPFAFERGGRFAPKYRRQGQLCPMDRGTGTCMHPETDTGIPLHEVDPCGCFYRCRVFSPYRANRPTKQQALDLIDTRVRQVELWIETGRVSDEEVK